MTTETVSVHDRAFLGHPRGLAVLFFAEMWERFSYYGMRALLVTFLVWHFLRSESHAYGVYAAYAGMIYLAPLLGGYLADKYLGSRKAVAFGAILITLGHFTMAYESRPATEAVIADGTRYEITHQKNPDGDTPQFVRSITVDGAKRRVEKLSAVQDAPSGTLAVIYKADDGEPRTVTGVIERVRDDFGESIMFLALALIIVGTGFLKANISTVVGALYGSHDPRRDSGFTLFYLGINTGAALGIALVGWIGIAYGWSYGFGMAGIGMLLGLIVFLSGQSWLEGRGDPPDAEFLRRPVGLLNREWIIYLAGFATVALAWAVVRYLGQFGLSDLLALGGLTIESVPLVGEFTLFDFIVTAVFLVSVFGIILFSISALGREERDRMIALLILTLSSVVFWTLFDQAPISLVIFQSKFVDTWIFTAQAIGFFNPVFILIFAPMFTILWGALGAKGRNPSAGYKFALGLVQIGLGFLVLNVGISVDGGDLTIGLVWISLMYMLHTTGELCLSPVGLSAVTKLSVPRLVGFMMGVWFMAVAIAQVAASLVSKATVVPEGTERAVALAQFNTVYFWLGIASILAGILMALAAPKLRAMMHGRL